MITEVKVKFHRIGNMTPACRAFMELCVTLFGTLNKQDDHDYARFTTDAANLKTNQVRKLLRAMVACNDGETEAELAFGDSSQAFMLSWPLEDAGTRKYGNVISAVMALANHQHFRVVLAST